MTIVRRTDTQRILLDERFEATLRYTRLRIVAAATLCAVSACAPVSFRGARFSEPSLTSSDAAAVVYVYHVASYLTCTTPGLLACGELAGNDYSGLLIERLYVDGKDTGVLTYYADQPPFVGFRHRCEYISVTLPPGSHEFRADYDPAFYVWSGLSRVPIAATATRIDLEAGQTYWVRIYSRKTPARTLLGSPKPEHTVEVVDRDTGLREITDCTLRQTP